MTIPASELVSVSPSVLSSGGAGVATIGLVLTENTRVPIGTVASFPDLQAVQNFFGANSSEAQGAAVYFNGFTNAQQIPSAILFAQYPAAPVDAYLRGGNISAVPISTLASYSGSIDVVVDGYARNASGINLAGSTTQSAAAATIQTALNSAAPSEATITANIGSSFTGTISGFTLTASSVTGLLSVGDTVNGSGVTTGTTITALISGTGGAGTYQVSASQTVGSEAMTTSSNVLDVTNVASGTLGPGQTVTGAGISAIILAQLSGATGGQGTYSINGSPLNIVSESMTTAATPVAVTYDSVSGAFVITSGVPGAISTIAFPTGTLVSNLLLTQTTGAVLSQGANAATPAAFMSSLVGINANWVAFMTNFNPDGSTGLNTVKQQFAAWKNGQPYAYVCWDTDITAANSFPAATSLGQILAANGDSGTILCWEPSDQFLAWFTLGMIASIDFQEPNGRITFAYKNQAGLVAGVTDPTSAANLAGNPQSAGSRGNGYNFYGAYATAGSTNLWFQRGFVTGPFLWADSYINQIWLNNQLQIALLGFLGSTRSAPFNNTGYNAVANALQPAIDAGLSFGAFGPGTITQTQANSINASAGNANASAALQAQGYYLQVVPASGTIKSARGPLQVNFWYLDNGSIQVINLNSIALE